MGKVRINILIKYDNLEIKDIEKKVVCGQERILFHVLGSIMKSL